MNASNTYNIVQQSNTTFNLQITWKDSTGTPVNLTGYSAAMAIKANASIPEAFVALTVGNGITLDSLGNITITMSPSTMANIPTNNDFVYDLLLKSPLGVIYCLLVGTFTVNPGVSSI